MLVPTGLHEACGVIGVYAPGRDVARLAFFGLYALQHRGQESAGIATTDGRAAYLHKGMGLVSQVFNEENLRPLRGHIAIGHNRYSTTGGSHVRNAQPYLIETIHGPLGVAHNGNLTNALHLRRMLMKRGVGLTSSSDSEAIVQILAASPDVWPHIPPVDDEGDLWIGRIRALMQLAEGAYALTILTRHALYAVRDPRGLRPLCLGELDEGYVIASESCALQTIGARYVREIEPGEIVRIDASGLSSLQGAPCRRRALCIFEYVYFSRPDSLMEGQVIHTVRQEMGRQLAREAPADADVVVGVPDSATPHAIGYSLESGIPYTEGLIKNRYIGRTFIQPDDKLRREGVRLKYNPLPANLEGKRVVLVDDSIVRGNTAGPLVQLLRDAGAREVHVRVASPPVRHPCFMGVDMATYGELIAHRYDIEEIRRHIGADSLAYLSLPGLLQAVYCGMGEPTEPRHCTACFSGDYPLDVPEWLFAEDRSKVLFEN
ncbi:amidophosphoribosyltransferase [Ardenticatena maritima]|nr:amidophosphoribosyltransferase [Ardenticatena maritima]GAP63636.1 amidophosphoribosyltransferase [Ardenticatena maritima]